MINSLKFKVQSSKFTNKKGKTSSLTILSRINRIKGQVEGIEKMIMERRSCLEVVQQIAAVRSALAKVSGIILVGESCREKGKSDENFERVVTELVKNI